MSKWSKEVTRKFIKEYEKQPCLWDRNHPQYRDNEVRNVALRQITTSMDIEGITVAIVRAKICALRGTYNMELKKIYRAKKAGTSYVPGLSWFNDMDNFIETGQKRRNNRLSNSLHTIESIAAMSDDSEDEKSFLVFKPKHGDESPTNSEIVIEQDQIEPIPHNSAELEESPPSKRIHYFENASSNKMSSSGSTVLHDFTIASASSINTNEFELFSKQISLQLQQLPLDMALDLQMQIHTLVYKKRIEWIQSCGSQ